MKRRARVPSILLNNDFYSKPRNLRFIKENGLEAIPIVQAVWIAASQERDFRILKEDALAIPLLAFLDEEKVTSVLNAAVSFGLIEEKDGYYFNSQTISDATEYLGKKEGEAERKRLERERKKEGQERTADVCPSDVQRTSRGFPISDRVSDNDLDPDLKNKKTVPAFETKAVVVSRSKPEPGACEIAPGVWVDEITRETAIMAFQRVGLAAEDIPRAGQILARSYERNPNSPRRGDIQASWVIQELLKEKKLAEELSNAKSRGKPKPPNDGYTKALQLVTGGDQ